MPKITAVKVWGFESHTNTDYKLAPGLNVFTGPTDGGKTSGTIRALRWLAKGEPSGEDFIFTVRNAAGDIERQAEEVGVEVTLDNGTVIKKIRRNKKTKYWLTGYTEPFEKAEVPQQVIDALGMKTSRYGDFEVDLNFAYQLDPPFLISQPGSAGAKVLGKLAGTEAVDGAIKSVSKETYAARAEKAAADKEYESKVEKLKSYEGLGELQEQLNAAEWIISQIDEALQKKESIQGLQKEIMVVNERIVSIQVILEKLLVIPDLEQDVKNIEKAQQRYDTLLDLFAKWERATATVEDLNRQLQVLQGLDATEWLLSQVIEHVAKAETLRALSIGYQRYRQEVKIAQETIEATKDLDVLVDSLTRVEDRTRRLGRMQESIAVYKEIDIRRTKAAAAVKYLEPVNEAEVLIPLIEINYNRLQKLLEVQRVFKIKNTTKQQAVDDVTRSSTDLAEAEKDLSTAWEATGGICPLCEQPTNVVHNH